MGMSPPDVRKMSLWDFRAAIEGWIKANSPEEKQEQGLTSQEVDDLAAFMKRT